MNSWRAQYRDIVIMEHRNIKSNYSSTTHKPVLSIIHIVFTIWEVLPHSYGSNRKDNRKKSENFGDGVKISIKKNTFPVIWGKYGFRSTGVCHVLNVSRNLNLNFAEILGSPHYWIL